MKINSALFINNNSLYIHINLHINFNIYIKINTSLINIYLGQIATSFIYQIAKLLKFDVIVNVFQNILQLYQHKYFQCK